MLIKINLNIKYEQGFSVKGGEVWVVSYTMCRFTCILLSTSKCVVVVDGRRGVII